jgi:hypothetical protein
MCCHAAAGGEAAAHTHASEPSTYFTGQLVAVALYDVHVGRDGGDGPHYVALQHVGYNSFGCSLGECCLNHDEQLLQKLERQRRLRRDGLEVLVNLNQHIPLLLPDALEG